ncbi:MAG: copper-translocating P-type ATPase [Lachnospiraceae bacterium]|nr:copper-translocating P-type ATPase [Lachnospiraceae bacterium]
MSDYKKMTKVLFLSVILTIILVLLSLFQDQIGQIPLFIIRSILSLVVIFLNRRIFINGLVPVIRGSFNMDTLVSLGAGAAFIYSIVISVINMIYYKGSTEYIGESELYFESCSIILTIVLAGKVLEEITRGKTADAVKDLADMSPKTALLLDNGQEREVPVEEIKAGDLFILKPGMSVPADGIIESGTSAVNEASLTGESMPVDKEPGMTVCASTINMSGFLTCRATNVGADTAFSRIVQMVSDASSGKAAISRTADRICAIFIPFVILLSVICFIIWMVSGMGVSFSIARAVSVLIVSCPCALSLAAPIAIMIGNSVAGRHGILYKTAQAIENTGKTQIVVVDKTGTLTTGNPKITDIISTENDIEHRDLLLSIAYALESKSEHPLAKAICSYAEKRFVKKLETTDFEAIPGKGIKAGLMIAGQKRTVYAGSEAFIGQALVGKDDSEYSNEFSAIIRRLVAEGKTPTLFASESGMLGVIAAADEIKEGSSEAISALHAEDIHVCMVTGDKLANSEAVGAQVGIEPDEVISEVLPDEKAAIVAKLKETGKVAMIGDGVNDAPALTVADAGIAIGAGTDVAVDAADVVLIQDSLITAVDAIRLSRDTLKIIRQNLFWALSYNVIGIPLAAGCFYKAFGWILDPMLCAAAMSLSSLFVITNALRIFSFTTTTAYEPEEQTEESTEDD